jgi:hypothetical protein
VCVPGARPSSQWLCPIEPSLLDIMPRTWAETNTCPLDQQGFFYVKEAEQADAAFPAFWRLFRETPFDLVVELGTGCGVFALFLDEYKPRRARFVTYDLVDRRSVFIRTRTYDLRLGDIFTLPTILDVWAQVQTSRKVLILCDGPTPPVEFRIYSSLLRPGDVIMLHNYAESVDYFQRAIDGKHWTKCLWFHSHIADVCQRQRLQPVRRDLFELLCWGAFEKQP